MIKHTGERAAEKSDEVPASRFKQSVSFIEMECNLKEKKIRIIRDYTF